MIYNKGLGHWIGGVWYSNYSYLNDARESYGKSYRTSRSFFIQGWRGLAPRRSRLGGRDWVA